MSCENNNPVVGIIMGSESDMPAMEPCMKQLDEFGIPYEVKVASAHRKPAEVHEWASTAHERGIRVIVAAAGKAAHLGGVVAAYTPNPVITVPMKTSDLGGLDSLLSMVQMHRLRHRPSEDHRLQAGHGRGLGGSACRLVEAILGRGGAARECAVPAGSDPVNEKTSCEGWVHGRIPSLFRTSAAPRPDARAGGPPVCYHGIRESPGMGRRMFHVKHLYG